MDFDPRHWINGWMSTQAFRRVLGVGLVLLLILICWLVWRVNVFWQQFSG